MRPEKMMQRRNERNSRHSWRNLLEQLQPFPADTEIEQRKTRRVATRPRKKSDLSASVCAR